MTEALTASYAACKRVAARHGRTYFLATRLLPPERRPAVHALYALARVADDIVDGPAARGDIAGAAARLDWFAGAFFEGFGGRSARSAVADPVLPAVHDTVARLGLQRDLFEAFFASMRMDLVRDSYADFAELSGYTYGSAEVIGLQMLPVLGVQPGAETAAADAARALGLAFQLTNFVRDVGEDLDRGRLYLPLADLETFGLSRGDLERRVVDDRVRGLLAHQIDRIREIYRRAELGIELLDPVSQDCVRTAFVLYAEILDAVEAADYGVLDSRASVGIPRRVSVFVPALLRARRARRSHHTHHARVWTTREKPNSRSSTGA